MKDRAFYLRMAQELEDKEKGKGYVAQVKRNHQVWSSGDEDEDDLSKGKGKICMVATANEDGSTNLKKNHCYMAKDGTLSIVEQVKLMIQNLNYSMHDCEALDGSTKLQKNHCYMTHVLPSLQTTIKP